MARLHEYQGKAILAANGFKIPRVHAVSNADEAVTAVRELDSELATKVQAWTTRHKKAVTNSGFQPTRTEYARVATSGRFAFVKRFILLFCTVALLPGLASAKRVAPARVEPVIHKGIRYVAPNDDGRRGYVEAWDVQSDRKLWELTVFTNRFDPGLEEGVQWVFIKRLKVEGGVLMVTSERGETYSIDLKTRAIRRSGLARSPAPDRAAQAHDIPEAVERAIRTGSLPKDYDASFDMDPFYLSGDFNGDGKSDVAVLVKQRSTGKLGIAIIHGATNKVTILGAGVSVGNGGDDFEWMDSWQVYSKHREAGDSNVPRLQREALLVGKSEAASALIYWNGKRYVWFQQGD